MEAVLDRTGIDQLIAALRSDGYRVIGPTVRDRAVVLDEISSVAELPGGWVADAAPGRVRLRRHETGALLGPAAGQPSWKRFVHPPRQRLWTSEDGSSFTAEATEPIRYALLGVRPCDLAALQRLRTVLAPDRGFTDRERNLFVIAAGCTEPGPLCFCASTGTGPGAGSGYDLVLTEQPGGDGGYTAVVGTGSAAGERLLERVAHRPATPIELERAAADLAAAAQELGHRLPADARERLAAARVSEQWQQVAERCLECGNCTMVCPTCFCTTTEDRTDIASGRAEHAQRWASCFELDFSYLHGGSVRTSRASRYRQWITHKLSTWQDQFGAGGCVGCGRCIAWCPVGIDITAEVARLSPAGADVRTAEQDA